MNFVQILTLLVLLAVGVIGILQGLRVLQRRVAEAAPGVSVTGRWAGLLGLIYLGGGLAAGGVALLWLFNGL